MRSQVAGRIGLSVALSLVCVSAAVAAEVSYELRAGATYSDNIELQPSGLERDTTAIIAGLTLDGMKDTGRLKYNLAADIEHQEYLDVDIDGELMGRARLNGSYDFIPDAFSWSAGLGYDQTRGDPSRPLAPGNSSSQTTLTTGPAIRLRLGNSMESRISGHYSQLNNESSTVSDNETLGGRLLLLRSRSSRSELGVGVSYDDVTYDSDSPAGDAGFERKEAFVRANYAGTRTNIELETGYSKVAGPLVSDSGLLVRSRLSRRIAPTLTVFVGYIREYPTSESSNLTPVADDVDAPLGDPALESAPRISTAAQAGIQMQRPRTSALLTYDHRKEKSIIVGIGQREYDRLHASVTRQFTPGSRGTLFYFASQEGLSQFASGFDEQRFGGGFEFDIGRALAVEFRVHHSQRDSAISVPGYDETSGGIYLNYRGEFGRSAAATASR